MNRLSLRNNQLKFKTAGKLPIILELLTNEPVEVPDCWKKTNHFRGIYGIYPNFIKET
jgi:hypothetical protein